MNRKYLLITLIVFLAGVVGLTVLMNALGAKSLGISGPMAKNFRYAQLVSDDKARFFNGSAFMEFDIMSQTASPLTPSYVLPNVIDVRWGKAGVLFKATGYGPSDQLRPVLTAAKAPTTTSYWWYADFSTGAVSVVGSLEGAAASEPVVEDVVWTAAGDSYYYIQKPTYVDGDNPVATLYQATPGSVGTSLGQTDAVSLGWASGDKVVYQTEDKLRSFNVAGRSVKTIKDGVRGSAEFDSNGAFGLNLNASSAGFESFADASGPLELINLSDGTSKTVIKTLAGSWNWQLGSTDWVAIDNSKAGKLTGQQGTGSGQDKALNFVYKGGKKMPEGLKVVGHTAGQMLLIDQDNTAYIAAAKAPVFKAEPPANSDQPAYVGTDEMIARGLADAQLEGMKVGFRRYLAGQKLSVSKIAIISGSLVKTPHDRFSASTTDSFTFNVSFDDKGERKALLEYSSLSGVRLVLSDPATGKAVYDSGPIDVSAR